MSTTSYTCSHCDHRFELDDDAEQRCPSCLRTNGLLERSDTVSTEEGDSFRTKVLVGLTLVAAVALILTLNSGGNSEKKQQNDDNVAANNTSLTTGTTDEVHLADLGTLSAELKEAAQGLADPVKALRQAAQENLLPSRSSELPDALGAPRRPELFLGALKGKLAPNIGSFEWVRLAGSLLQAKSGKDVTYGYDKESKSRSVLEHREYVVVDPQGNWQSQDGKERVSERIHVMSAQELRANALAWYAMASATVGDLDQASRSIGEARKLDSADPALGFTEGRIQLASDLRERGWATLDGVANNQKDDPQAFVTIGELALGLKAPFRATRAFQSAIAIDQDFAPALLGLARVEMERLLVTPESEKANVKAGIESRLAKVASAKNKDSDLRAVQADLAQLDKNAVKRRELLELGVQENPTSLLAALNMVQFHIENKAVEAALAAGLRGHASGIRDPRLSTQLGVLHFELVGQALIDGDQSALGGESKRILEGALKHLEQAKLLAPEQRDIRLLLSQVHYLSGNLEEGKKLLDEQAKRFPKDTEGLLVSAQLAMKDGDYQGARRKLKKVFEIDSKHRDAAAINYLLAIVSAGDVLSARRKALSLGYPRLVLAQSVLESIHVDPRGLDEVLSLMNEEIEADPQSIEAHNLKAVALTLLGKDEEAKKMVDQAVLLVPDANQAEVRQALEAQLGQAKLALKAQQVIERQRGDNAPNSADKDTVKNP